MTQLIASLQTNQWVSLSLNGKSEVRFYQRPLQLFLLKELGRIHRFFGCEGSDTR